MTFWSPRVPRPRQWSWPRRGAWPARRVPRPLVPIVGRDDDLVRCHRPPRVISARDADRRRGRGQDDARARRCDGPGSAAAEAAFVDLASVAAPDGVAAAFARDLGVERSGEQDWPARLVEVLGQASMLVVVDNAEHVVDAVAALVAHLLGATPIAVLVTSRTPLGIAGEALFPVDAARRRRRSRPVRPTCPGR